MLWVILAIVLLAVVAGVVGVIRLIHIFGQAMPARMRAKRLLEEVTPLRELDGAVPDLEWFDQARRTIISAAVAPPIHITDRPGREEFPRYLEALERLASGQG